MKGRALRVLVACEESQAVCKAFRELGHTAFSCDVRPCSGGHPEWHYQARAELFMRAEMKWDILIAFPSCTYMANSSAMRMKVNGVIQEERYQKMLSARDFFMDFYECDFIPHIAIENPVPMKLCNLPPYNQIIQPYMFGHPYSKRTCLWLKNLPMLTPTEMVSEHEPYVNGGFKDKQGNYRQFKGRDERNPITRAKTFPGIAKAMAEQWSKYVNSFQPE